MVERFSLVWFVRLLTVLAGLVSTGVAGGLTAYYAGDIDSFRPAPSQASSELSLVNAVRRVKPAVVTIVNQQEPRLDDAGSATSIVSGSGVIFDPRGYILTNDHVVALDEKITVIFEDGHKTPGTLVGEDSLSDLAVLQVAGPVPAVASFGDSGALEPGEMVMAIGSPYEKFDGSVTFGLVSGLDRQVGGLHGLIQTDAAINPGNSGGPLVTTRGEVAGINNLVLRTTSEGRMLEGMGFAIPANQALEVARKLLAR